MPDHAAITRDAAFATHGEAATVTPPGSPSITTTVIRGTGFSAAFPPAADLGFRERVQTIALRRDQVPSIPGGTLIVIGAESFTVDAVDREDRDGVVHVVVR